MALDKKDRLLVTKHTIGEKILEVSPVLDEFLTRFAPDDNLRKAFVGDVAVNLFNAMLGNKPVKPLKIRKG